MVKLLNVGITLMIVVFTCFTGCLDDDDNGDEGDEFNFNDTTISQSFLVDREGDQTLIGGFTDQNGDFFHIYHHDGPDDEIYAQDDIYKYNNETGEEEIIETDDEIRAYDLNGEHLWVYRITYNSPAERDHRLVYLNLMTGEYNVKRTWHVSGEVRNDDNFRFVGSAGKDQIYDGNSGGLFCFTSPHNNDGVTEWDLEYIPSTSNVFDYVETNVQTERNIIGDSGNDSGAAYIYENNLFLYNRIGHSDTYERTMIDDVIDVSGRENYYAIVKSDGVYIFTLDDPINLTYIEGTEGAQEVDIFIDFLLITKYDGTYLYNINGEYINIYSERITNLWLHEPEGPLLRACGTFDGNGDDSGHIDITLNI